MFAERRLRVLRIFNPQISEAKFLQHGIVIAQRSSGPWGSMRKCVVPIFRSYRWPIRARFIILDSCYYPYFKIGIAVEYISNAITRGGYLYYIIRLTWSPIAQYSISNILSDHIRFCASRKQVSSFRHQHHEPKRSNHRRCWLHV